MGFIICPITDDDQRLLWVNRRMKWTEKVTGAIYIYFAIAYKSTADY